MKLRWFFLFFFLSGLCSLIYEIVWLRLTMAAMGVTTPLISTFLSIFMAGLGLGSWALGKYARRREGDLSFHPLRWYAATELLIGISAFAVPYELRWARNWLDVHGSGLALSSGLYYFVAGALLSLILLPWSTCMGATFPFAMAAIRKLHLQHQRSFSFLYLANVLGAVLGAVLPAFVLVELLGFLGTLHTTAILNVFIAIVAFSMARRRGLEAAHVEDQTATAAAMPVSATSLLLVLFLTGLTSMAMEVVWIRQYTPFVGTTVYAFALILGFYLLATFLGSQFYRRWSRSRTFQQSSFSWMLLGIAGVLPLLTADPRLSAFHVGVGPLTRLGIGVMPFSGLVGFLTPMLVDQFSSGDPGRAGRAYAVNIWGCILGPLLSGFLLLPHLGERSSIFALSVPLFLIGLLFSPRQHTLRFRVRILAETAALGILLFLFTKDYEVLYPQREVRRDYAATAIAANAGMYRNLIVNGTNLTSLTPITKVMAHLPMALMNHTPQRALVICFGMGTTHRSILSWGTVSSTAVELLPSVPQLYHYFHEDGPALLRSPNSTVIIDDGRMFLSKTNQKFDLITVDPPPPISAAGSSLLYSQQFCELVKQHLAPGGIFQQWMPGGDLADYSAIARALGDTFPYVRVFKGVEGWGLHFLASSTPIPTRNAAELAARIPTAAAQDLVEWGPGHTAEQQFDLMLKNEIPFKVVANVDPLATIGMQDDRPVNEYWLLRTFMPSGWRAPVFSAMAAWRSHVDKL